MIKKRFIWCIIKHAFLSDRDKKKVKLLIIIIIK